MMPPFCPKAGRNNKEYYVTFDIIMGVILTALALVVVVLLTFWSRSIIEAIHARSPGSLRDFRNDIHNGDKS